MNILDAVKSILNKCDSNTICLFTNGFISRIGFSVKDRLRNFYMIGSMGLVSSVALGIALNTQCKVIIFDGDGSLLMNMGILPLIGHERPANLIHLVFDNKAYGSTGNQPTVSGTVDFCGVASSVGYANVFEFDDLSLFKKKIGKVLSSGGPVFVRFNIKSDDYSGDYKRINIAPEVLTKRLSKALKELL